MLSQWRKLEGDLSFEERELVNNICVNGLKETRRLLEKRKSSQTEGAILAFETIEEQQFTTCEEFLDQRGKLERRCIELRDNEQSSEYWEVRGQQLQIEFILDRILAYRVMSRQLAAHISARAGLYVGEWHNKRTTGL